MVCVLIIIIIIIIAFNSRDLYYRRYKLYNNNKNNDKIPVQHSIAPPYSAESDVNGETIWPAELSRANVGDVRAIAEGATNARRLSVASQPLCPEKKSTERAIQRMQP